MAMKRLERRTAAIVAAASVAGAALVAVTSGGPVPSPVTRPCRGIPVAAGSDLSEVSAAEPPGTTFCLAAGEFNVATTVDFDPGDSIVGAGRDKTFIKPAGVAQPTNGFGSTDPTDTGTITYAHLDIGGFTADPASTSCDDACGTAILNESAPTGTLVLDDIQCHDNGTHCVGHGFGSVTMTNSECNHNGYHQDSLQLDFRSSACIKLSEGSLIVEGSFIHDNAFDGLWCDFCGNTHSRIEFNRIVHNGRSGVYWEMSGGFVAGDNIVIGNNVIQNNGWNCSPIVNDSGSYGSQLAAAITSEDGSNMLIESNMFGGNSACGEGGFRALKTYDGSRSGVVRDVTFRSNILNGDSADCATYGTVCSGSIGP